MTQSSRLDCRRHRRTPVTDAEAAWLHVDGFGVAMHAKPAFMTTQTAEPPRTERGRVCARRSPGIITVGGRSVTPVRSARAAWPPDNGRYRAASSELDEHGIGARDGDGAPGGVKRGSRVPPAARRRRSSPHGSVDLRHCLGPVCIRLAVPRCGPLLMTTQQPDSRTWTRSRRYDVGVRLERCVRDRSTGISALPCRAQRSRVRRCRRVLLASGSCVRRWSCRAIGRRSRRHAAADDRRSRGSPASR